MVNDALLRFVKEQLSAGTTREHITAMLLGQGWTAVDIDQAFASVATASPQPVPTAPAPMPIAPISTPLIIPARMPEKTKHHRVLAALVIIILIGLLAACAYAYYFMMVPPTPTAILKNALQNTLSHLTQPFSFAGISTTTIADNIGASEGLPSLGGVVVTANGSVDISSTSTPKLSLTFGVHGIAADSHGTDSLDVSADIIFITRALYAKLDNLTISYNESGPNQAQIASLLALANKLIPSLENTWVEIDAGTSTPMTMQAVSTSTALTQSEADSIRNYIFGMSYVSSASNLGVESVGGVSTYHIQAVIADNGQLADLVRSISFNHNPSLATSTAFNTQMDSLAAAAARPIAFDIWIGKNDFRVYKISVGQVAFDDAQEGLEATTSSQVSFSDYGNVSPIFAPIGAIPLDQFLQNALQKFYTVSGFGGAPVTSSSHINQKFQ